MIMMICGSGTGFLLPEERHTLSLTGISALQDCLHGTIFEATGGPSANHLIQARPSWDQPSGQVWLARACGAKVGKDARDTMID